MTQTEDLNTLRREVTRLAGLVEQLRLSLLSATTGQYLHMHPVVVGHRLAELIERLELAERERAHDTGSTDSTRSVRGR